jgi:hypothetical protein
LPIDSFVVKDAVEVQILADVSIFQPPNKSGVAQAK